MTGQADRHPVAFAHAHSLQAPGHVRGALQQPGVADLPVRAADRHGVGTTVRLFLHR